MAIESEAYLFQREVRTVETKPDCCVVQDFGGNAISKRYHKNREI
jgi:hypothetical protein